MPIDVVIIGAGAAGILAAIRCAQRGLSTMLLEKNARPGVKILMSGGTRCNVTHATDVQGILDAYHSQGRFLKTALWNFTPDDILRILHDHGCPTKVEETGKIFPVSDRATDVLAALMQALHSTGAQIRYESAVRSIVRHESDFEIMLDGDSLRTRRIIVTTGGKSYPGCGTTGDAYNWATSLGHTIVTPRPALVPLTTNIDWVRDLTGMTLPDVRVHMELPKHLRPKTKRPPLDHAQGSFLFTHFGLSGPSILDVSGAYSLAQLVDDTDAVASLVCDFCPNVSGDALTNQFQQALQAKGKQTVISLFPDHLPRRFAESLLEYLGIPAATRLSELRKDDRLRLEQSLKGVRIPLSGTRGFKKAEVTAGGIELSEVDPKSMQSRLCPGLYFAGEVLDIDGPIGGFNFQAAFSTAWLAADSI
ncbi:MAG: NAD(P)/FAD-dependent oxidoreductase [Planctomycetales bacterium]|nr:NAD(P)/FAD-dependent oxidoreductase [Planctomycetales bacterium]